MEEAGSSAPVLHEMQPPVRAPAPTNGNHLPPAQHKNPMPNSRAPIKPMTFRFQTVKKQSLPEMSPIKAPMKPPHHLPHPIPYIPPRPQPAYRPVNNHHATKRAYHNNNGQTSYNGGGHPMTPSTSYSDRNLVRKPPQAPPVYRSPPQNRNINQQCYNDVEITSNGQIDSGIKLNVVDSTQTTIELPPNCKLFQYSCEVGGVQRTLLVPMPSNATEEDVIKMLPESFSEMAASIFQKEIDIAPDEMPKLTIPNNEPREEPTLVNPKQFMRIQRRREMRMKLEMSGRLPMQRQKYLHESRHRHAISRKRGVDGRFDPKLPSDDGARSTSSGLQYRAMPLTRPARTYAAIRPANEMSSYGRVPAETVRRLQPVTNLSSSLPSTSMPSTSTSSESYYDHQGTVITSFQQYQQHVQYTADDSHHYQGESSNGAGPAPTTTMSPGDDEATMTNEETDSAPESDQQQQLQQQHEPEQQQNFTNL